MVRFLISATLRGGAGMKGLVLIKGNTAFSLKLNVLCFNPDRNENVPVLNGFLAFSSDFYLFKSSKCTLSVNYFCEKLFTLKANIFIYD